MGEEGQSYGRAPKDATSWKQKMLGELAGQLDLDRVHFLGRIAYADFINLLHVSRGSRLSDLSFVLSWSLMEAMAAGCAVVASDTAPVREVIRDGETGRLVDFFDIAGWGEALIAGLSAPKLRTDAGRRAASYHRDLLI